jgi:Cdc6-like AAA superfamily ATPase
MLDFDPADLDYFRQVGQMVEFTEEPGVVETALALSGSSAQSKIQSYPGDLDFFERVNIKAPTRQEACAILSRIMRDKALSTFEGETYRLIEVKYGSYSYDIVKEGRSIKSGAPIAWMPDELGAGQIEASRPDGTPATITWDEAADDPGWCKLDWVVADPVRDQVANASNMLDVTWEAPDGSVIPLDGYLDPYFQEVYLEAESIPIFSKLVRHVSENALDDYVAQLEEEVRKYVTKDINYGKAAKRMYNIFRLTGRYQDAAFLRELFDPRFCASCSMSPRQCSIRSGHSSALLTKPVRQAPPSR